MSIVLALLLKPFVALFVFAPACALGVTLARRMKEGRIKRVLLFRIHKGQSANGPDGAIEKAAKWVVRHVRKATRWRS